MKEDGIGRRGRRNRRRKEEEDAIECRRIDYEGDDCEVEAELVKTKFF